MKKPPEGGFGIKGLTNNADLSVGFLITGM